ncbi:hypothetical protein J5X84_00910 [Streptosporangiaceae bacterium NEAU-GS5]|nr:hypothetical protein [Streptosporangiaceae bacterium NEAU-GS5]
MKSDPDFDLRVAALQLLDGEQAQLSGAQCAVICTWTCTSTCSMTG